MESAVDLGVDLAGIGRNGHDARMIALSPGAYSALHSNRLLVARLDAVGLFLPVLLLDINFSNDFIRRGMCI